MKLMNPQIPFIQPDEQVIFQSDDLMLTNQRVVANWNNSGRQIPEIQKPLTDILACEKLNGGSESRVRSGLKLIAIGLITLGFNLVLHGIIQNGFIDSLLFIIEAASLIYGTYMVLLSLATPKPKTTILFTEVNSKTFAVSLPGWDNPDAQTFTTKFDQLKQSH